MSDDIKKLLPGKRITLTTKERVEIRPVPFGKLPAFTESVAELFSKLRSVGLKLEEIEDWKVVLEVAAEETIRIMAFVIGKPREWFDEIDIADGLEILNIIIEQNLTERAKKNLKALLERWSSLLPTRSRHSSPQDTRGAISEDTPSIKSDSSPGASSSSEV
ncbi:MAG: hypothetical protein AB1423_14465 [Pseudomonadota bacterium]